MRADIPHTILQAETPSFWRGRGLVNPRRLLSQPPRAAQYRVAKRRCIPPNIAFWKVHLKSRVFLRASGVWRDSRADHRTLRGATG